jgi:hypothetical protein
MSQLCNEKVDRNARDVRSVRLCYSSRAIHHERHLHGRQ